MLDLPEEEAQSLDSFGRFLERWVRPFARQVGEQPLSAATAREFLCELAQFGVGSMFVRARDGGVEFPNRLSGRMIEALCRVDGGLGAVASLHDGTVGIFSRLASAELKARYLPDLMAGKKTICMAITEPDVGSNPREVRTRATFSNGVYHLRGEKTWISNAPIADLAIVICRTGDDSATALSMILVDRARHGFGTGNLDKLGLHSWPTGTISLDARVPAENLIGEPGKGLAQTLIAFERARCFVGAISLGIAQAALEYAVEYAGQRVQWGKPIAAHQSIQNKLAEMALDLDAARLLVYRGLHLVDQGARCDTQTSMAKWFATEMGVRVTDAAMQVMGAYGLSPQYPVARLFRDARVMTVPDGTSDIQKLVIARNLTGISAF